MNGLRIEVYRAGDYDSTMDGISSKYDNLTLIGKGINGPFAPSDDAPTVTVVTRVIFGEEYKHLVPCDENAQPLPGWWMFGGNYGKTPDSRFPHPYPLAIHDRMENKPEPEPGLEMEPVKVGQDLLVKFKGEIEDEAGNKIGGTWKQRFDIRYAGKKIAQEMKASGAKVIGIEVVDRIELRPAKKGN